MQPERTLLLRRSEIEDVLSLRDCIDAVEEVFRLQGHGKIPSSEILGVKAPNGGLHVKAALLPRSRSYIVAKLNTNFPVNRTQSAKYLARKNSSVATICGCGGQARAQLRAIHSVLALKKIHAFDLNEGAAKNLAVDLSRELKLDIEPTRDLPTAIQKSDVCVTCTTSTEFFVRKEDVASGTFIAAVGADDAHKQEIDPALIATAKVVADSLEQSCTIGDTRHAIGNGLMRKEDVYAELGEIVAGRKSGRTTGGEIFIFDSTGVAMEDAVAAAAVYEKARTAGIGTFFQFAA